MFSKDTRRSIRYSLVYWFVRFLIATSGSIPRSWWLSFCGFLGALAYRFATQTRNLTLRHLALAFPEKSPAEIKKLAKQTFRMLGKNAGEILRASRVKTLADLNRVLITEGFETRREKESFS